MFYKHNSRHLHCHCVIRDAVASDSVVHVGISDRTARPQYSSTVVGFHHHSEDGGGASGEDDDFTITVIEVKLLRLPVSVTLVTLSALSQEHLEVIS